MHCPGFITMKKETTRTLYILNLRMILFYFIKKLCSCGETYTIRKWFLYFVPQISTSAWCILGGERGAEAAVWAKPYRCVSHGRAGVCEWRCSPVGQGTHAARTSVSWAHACPAARMCHHHQHGHLRAGHPLHQPPAPRSHRWVKWYWRQKYDSWLLIYWSWCFLLQPLKQLLIGLVVQDVWWCRASAWRRDRNLRVVCFCSTSTSRTVLPWMTEASAL